ncbi:MAG: S-layer homology domain-containing protein [Defluviitaleaceae bacterium]|nr:S-layer homology domain-containing protein [Defluviitaleaceae bacterium]
MKKFAHCLLVVVLFAAILGVAFVPVSVDARSYAGAPFVPNPRTEYAREFIAASEGQQWFMDVVESVLNVHGKSINTINSRADLDAVVSVGLFDAGISGRIPRAIGELRNLQFLHLGRNNLSGAIPAELVSITSLREVDLSENSLTGSIPAGIGGLANLRILLLRDNQLSGAIPAGLGGLSRLEVLDVSSNNLTGGIPSALGNLSALQILNLSDNNLGGTIPAQLGNLAQLRVLMAWNCGLTGALPAQLGNLSNLLILDLSQNALTGAIPASLTSLGQLRELALSDNNLSGNLPAVAAGSDIQVLDLARNGLTGRIPDGYASMTSLRILDLDENDLSGIIPDVWSGMSDLATVWLRDNQFHGDVPASLAEVDEARVDDNHLFGANVSGMSNNAGNFVHLPGPDVQFRLEIDEYLWANVGQRINIFDLFRIVDSITGDEGVKPKLHVSLYEVAVVMESEFIPDGDLSDWFEITSDGNGIFITLLQEIAAADAILFELRMLPHDVYSPFSFVRFFAGTEAGMPPISPPPAPRPPSRPPASPQPSPPSGGTGGGGGSAGAGGGGVWHMPPPSTQGRAYVLEARPAFVRGISQTTFAPNAPMSRVDIAVALFNIAGRPEVAIRSPFVDVAISHPDIAAIAWVYENGLMVGYRDGTFRPDSSLTRGELATLIVNWRGYTPRRTTTFPDALNHWANGSIGAIEILGHVSGYPDGTFRPNAPIRRAEVVTLLNSLIGRSIDLREIGHIENPFTDVSERHWAFAEIMAAAVDHYVRVYIEYEEEEVEAQ